MFIDTVSFGVPAPGGRRACLHEGLPAVRAFLTRRVAVDEVDDMVQDVALRLQVCGRDDQIENGRAYLFQVARSVIMDRRRRDASHLRARHEPLAEIHHPSDDLSPARVLEGKQRLAQVLTALDELPPRTRQAFALHRFERMSYSAIAAHMGVSVSAIEKHIMKAIRHLVTRCAD